MYNIKIIETEDKIEVWKYGIPIRTGYKLDELENEATPRRKLDDMSTDEVVAAYKRKVKYYREKRHEIRRLVEMNYKADYTKFVTLTFAEQIEDVEEANYIFNKFVKRLKYNLKKPVAYLATWERTKKNRIHYHIIIFNLKFMKWSDLERVWGHGYIKINDVSHVESENVGRYIAKYFSKNLKARDMYKKAFFTSRNLKKPKKITLQSDEELQSIIDLTNSSYHTRYKQVSKVDDMYHESEIEYHIIDKNKK